MKKIKVAPSIIAADQAQLAKEVKKEIDLFTWDRVADKTIDVYCGVI